MVEFHVDAFKAIVEPEFRTGLEDIERMRGVSQVIDDILFGGGERRGDGDASEHGEADAVHEVIGGDRLVFLVSILAIVNRNSIVVVLDGGDGMRQPDA